MSKRLRVRLQQQCLSLIHILGNLRLQRFQVLKTFLGSEILHNLAALLSKKRDEFLLEARKRLADKGKKDAFDDKIRETIEAQGAKKGIKY